MILFWLFTISNAIQISTNLENAYILAKDEYLLLYLDDYFSGDELFYEIFPSENTILTNPSISCNYLNNESLPINTLTSTTIIQELPIVGESDIFLIYGINSEIILYYVGLDVNKIISTSRVNVTGNILQYQALSYNLNNIDYAVVLVIASEPMSFDNETIFINNLYYIMTNSEFANFYLLQPPVKINLPRNILLTIQKVYMSQGFITTQLLITGYSYKFPTILLYDLSNITDIKLLLDPIQIDIPAGFISDQYLLAVTNNLTHYIYVPHIYKIFQMSFYDQFTIIKEISIGLYTNQVFSMQLSRDSLYLLLGIPNGFLILTLDLEQIFFKSFNTANASVYMTSTYTIEGNFFALV